MTEKSVHERPRPEARFAGESHVFDLPAALRQLRAEAQTAAQHGHRQITIFHRGALTHALFAFQPGGELADHAARGVVTIHAIEGHLTVRAGEDTYELTGGMMVVLAPNVRHSVCAGESSGAAMLLTVCRESSDAG